MRAGLAACVVFVAQARIVGPNLVLQLLTRGLVTGTGRVAITSASCIRGSWLHRSDSAVASRQQAASRQHQVRTSHVDSGACSSVARGALA